MNYREKKKVFIVIVFYKDSLALKKCLKSLDLETQIPKVVVDNWSSEDLRVLDTTPFVIVPTKSNLGFAGGCNVGIRYALKHGAEAVLLLNQDTVVQKNFLQPLLESSYDIAAPVIKFRRAGEWVYDFGGKINWWIGRSYHLEGVHLGGVMASAGAPACHRPRCEERKIDYVSGCAMLAKKHVFEKIGLLDERYFLYFEDADFCLRAKKAGFTVGVEPKSLIFHDIKEKAKKPLWQRKEILKSNLTFINRWIPWYFRPAAYLYWLVLSAKVLWR